MYKKIGIDLGTNSIKIAVINNISDIYTLKNGKTYYIENNNIDKKGYFKFLKKSISNFLKISKISFASLNFSIPEISAFANSKIFFLNTVDKKSIEKSIKYTLEEKFNLENLDEYSYKWKITEMSKDKENAKTEIYASIIKKEILHSFSKLAKPNWKIENIEFQQISIGRLIKGNSVVLDLGHKTTKIYFYKDGKPLSSEVIPYGGKVFNDIIQENYTDALSTKQIEKIREKCCICSNEFIEMNDEKILKMSKIITEEALNLINEIKIKIRSLELQQDYFVGDIYYTGGNVNLKYFKELISKELDVNLKTLDLLVPKNEEENIEDISIYNIAASSKIFNKYKYYNDINFAAMTKKSFDYASIFLFMVFASSITFGSFIYVNTYYDGKLSEINSYIQSQSNTIVELDSKISNIDSQIYLNQDEIKRITDKSNIHFELSNILYILNFHTPKKISINDISIDKECLVVKGYSYDYSNIAILSEELKQYGTVNIDNIYEIKADDIYISKKVKGNYEFEMTINHYLNEISNIDINNLER